MIEVMLETIQMSLVSPHRIVVLKAVGEERYLPIWIGPCEAEAISLRLRGVTVPRPLTHDLIINLLHAFNAELHYIYINDLRDDTFYARLILDVEGKEMEIDARPSDAIAVAVRWGVPIYVAESVLDEAGVVPEEDVTEERWRDLDVFRDFLNTLNLDDMPTD